MQTQSECLSVLSQSDVQKGRAVSCGTLPRAVTTTMSLQGAVLAQWLERRPRDRKVTGSIPDRSGSEFSSSGSAFCADTYSVPVVPSC